MKEESAFSVSEAENRTPACVPIDGAGWAKFPRKTRDSAGFRQFLPLDATRGVSYRLTKYFNQGDPDFHLTLFKDKTDG